MAKLGPATRCALYIQLAGSMNHYLVIVITDYEFRFALILVKMMTETMYRNLVIVDIGWLDVKQATGGDVQIDVVDSPEFLGSHGNNPASDPVQSALTSRARYYISCSALSDSFSPILQV
jgi:hypothetical protein